MHNSRQLFIDKLNALSVRKKDLAAIAECDPSRMGDYVRGRSLPGPIVSRIEAAIDDVFFVYDTLKPFRIELSDLPKFRLALQDLRQSQAIQSAQLADQSLSVFFQETGVSQVQ